MGFSRKSIKGQQLGDARNVRLTCIIIIVIILSSSYSDPLSSPLFLLFLFSPFLTFGIAHDMCLEILFACN